MDYFKLVCFLLYHLMDKLFLPITMGFLPGILKFQWINEIFFFLFYNSQDSAAPEEDILLKSDGEILLSPYLLWKRTKGWN